VTQTNFDAEQELEFAESIDVLLIEDNAVDAKWVERGLRTTGSENFVIHQLNSINKVSEFLERHPVDVVVLDLNLPDSNGWHTVVHIADLRPDLPIVVLSGHDEVDTIREALLAGAQTYQVKSVGTQANLAERIDFAIRRKARELELSRRYYNVR
jgi:DNA-binding response OmpR family regulator